MRSRVLLGPLAILGACVLLPCARRAPADEPPVAPPAEFDAKRTDAERAVNEAAYRELLASRSERLLHEHLGDWVVIAGGKLFPADDRFDRLIPARTMEAALAAAASQVPKPHHRYVFRVGEDGDVHMSLGGSQLPHVLGNAFMALLGGSLTFEPSGQVKLNIGFRPPVTISAQGPEARPYLQPTLGAPGSAGRAETLFVLATGCSGYGTVSADTAARAELHLWEVPGVHHVEGAIRSGKCRRARARVQLRVPDLDVLIPLAIWP